MRILHLDAGREMRGGQWQVLRLIEGLAAEGVDSTLLAREAAPLYHRACKQGWRVMPSGFHRALIAARDHDLVHAHDARSHTWGALIPGARLIVARRVAFAPGSRWKYGRASHYIAVSEYVRSVLMQAGVPASKISVVYDGAPLLPPANGSEVLAVANANDRQKGASLTAEAARIAGFPVKFSVDLERDLHDAGLFVYITHSEGLGSAVLLAMSAGVPVLASNVGGLPEIIRHGENGMLTPNSAREIAKNIEELMANPPLARRLGEAGRRTVEQRFTVEQMVHRTMEIYGQVLR